MMTVCDFIDIEVNFHTGSKIMISGEIQMLHSLKITVHDEIRHKLYIQNSFYLKRKWKFATA